jgi:acyl-CoA reductase-like NAD-dependent aldehyde dehydrogenase
MGVLTQIHTRDDVGWGTGPVLRHPAVEVARDAQADWGRTPLRRRLEIVRRLRHALAARADELAAAVSHAQRSGPAETLAAEVLPLADACRFLERRAERLLAPRRHGGAPLWMRGVSAEVRREPWGVVLVIGPANYPLLLPGVQAVQALAAGNAVLWKPGRDGRPVAAAFCDLMMESGLPAGVVQVLPEYAEAAADAIAAGVDHVVLTGSAATGRAVLRQLAGRLTPATMELSGGDAVFVRADADLDRAARAVAFGLTFNGGATCMAPRRVFVHESVAEPFERRLRESVRTVAACPIDSTQQALSVRLVREAVEFGARLVAGRADDDLGREPFVVADASPEMRLLRTDLLAPVVSLVSVRDDAHALELSRGCPFALSTTVFGSEEGARRLAAEVDAGCVVVNDVIVPTADPRVPFGGRRESGFGVTRGPEGLLAMTRPKAVVTRRGRRLPHLQPGALDAELFRSYLAAVHGGRRGDRLRGTWRLLRSLVRLGRSAGGESGN